MSEIKTPLQFREPVSRVANITQEEADQAVRNFRADLVGMDGVAPLTEREKEFAAPIVEAIMAGDRPTADVVAMPGKPSVVTMITELLNDAMAGKVGILAVAYVHTDGDVVCRVSAGEGFYKLIGAIEGMKYDMLREAQGG